MSNMVFHYAPLYCIITIIIIFFCRSMSAERMFKQVSHHQMGDIPQDLRQMAPNAYGRDYTMNGFTKSTDLSNAGYCPNGAFPALANRTNKLPNYFSGAQGYNPVYSPVTSMPGYTTGTQSFLPPPPSYEEYRQDNSPGHKENTTLEGQNIWNHVKNEDNYEQPIKRIRIMSGEDIKNGSDV